MSRRLAVLGWVLASACAPGKFTDFVREGEPSDAEVADAGVPRDARAPTDARVSDAQSQLDTGTPVVPDAATVDAGTTDASAPGDGDAGDAGAGDAGGPPVCPTSSSGVIAISKPAVELARMAKSPVFGVRALGPIARWGETDHVWTFSNAARLDGTPPPAGTPTNFPFISFDGAVQPWNRPVTGPWTLKRSTAEDALPNTMLPLAQGETSVVSLVPTSLTRSGSETHTELYLLQYDYLTATKVWRATIEDGSEVAVRAAQPLFSAPPLFAVAARAEGDWMYVYACDAASNPSRCYAGRVLYIKRDDPSAYQVRTLSAEGQWGWTNNLQQGTPVLQNVNQSDLTVSYNNYLRRFVAVYGEVLSNRVTLRTSEAAYGPWSEPVYVDLPAPAAWVNMNIREHPPLAQNCERRLVISYFAPSAASTFPTDGDIVMAAIDLD